jgi:hypothetical protein
MRFALSTMALVLAAATCGAALAQTSAGTVCAPPAPMPADSDRPRNPPQRPEPPACVNLQTHIQRCRHGEYERFQAAENAFSDAVDTWNVSSRHYVDVINAWEKTVTDYSNCEVDALNAETRTTR